MSTTTTTSSRDADLGWVYVLTNPSMPGLVKIGYTKYDPQERARQISDATGVPLPFVVAHARQCPGYRQVEALLHRRLARHRVNSRREFFEMPLAEACEALDQAAQYRPTVSPVLMLRAVLALVFAALVWHAGAEPVSVAIVAVLAFFAGPILRGLVRTSVKGSRRRRRRRR